MYKQVIKKIIELGDSLPAISGRVADISENKKWLTEKDIEVEIKLTELIGTFRGKHSVYAEELHGSYLEEDNVWVIDSISNTINFIHGMPHYSIVLSHLHKGKVKFAVVYDPSNKELFTAEKGKGTFLNHKRVQVSSRKDDTVFLIGPYLTAPYTEKSLKVIKGMSKYGSLMRNFGSLGVHYAYVACGRADIAISFNEDTFPEFAGKLLVEEAGGKFTDFENHPFKIGTRGILATNGVLHTRIVKITNHIVY